jgi:hypothetical protein
MRAVLRGVSSLSHTHTLSLSLLHTPSLSLTHTHTHTPSLSHTHTPPAARRRSTAQRRSPRTCGQCCGACLSLTHTLSLALSHTHSLSLTHTHPSRSAPEGDGAAALASHVRAVLRGVAERAARLPEGEALLAVALCQVLIWGHLIGKEFQF